MTHPSLNACTDSPLEAVIDGGYCVGCGACAAVRGSRQVIQLNSLGMYQSTPADDAGGATVSAAAAVCPFSDAAADETAIATDLYGGTSLDDRIGYWRKCYVGHVAEADYRPAGSSGGYAKWIACELLRQGEVDFIVQVAKRERASGGDDTPLYEFDIFDTPEAAAAGARSAYYPVEMSGVLSRIRATPGRYAITGVPCFIKAVRLLQRADPVLRERVRFCVGIVCGHLKSTAYADLLGWQLGVAPGNLLSFDFRRKYPNATAKQKGVEAVGEKHDGGRTVGRAVVQDLFGTNYAEGLFKYKACDYCDDVLAETADVVAGDAWLPHLIPDGRGHNVIVIRNPVIEELTEQAVADGRLVLTPVSPDEVAQSQAGGLRHRRGGLAYRLHQARARGEWVPRKRVAPGVSHLTRPRRQVFKLREQIAEVSHVLFQEAVERKNLDRFMRRMKPLLKRLRTATRNAKGRWWRLRSAGRQVSVFMDRLPGGWRARQAAVRAFGPLRGVTRGTKSDIERTAVGPDRNLPQC